MVRNRIFGLLAALAFASVVGAPVAPGKAAETVKPACTCGAACGCQVCPCEAE